MPNRFYLYMVGDVLKQFMITVVILVVVIAFGAAIKPLSSEQLLSGWDTLKYLMLAMVPMLQFAIPFAAAFATTIVIHRLSQDNEIIAMALSGQSYTKLLGPIALFGGVLTLTLVLLTQLVIPHFVGMMADTMTADLPRLLSSSIKKHTPFIQGNLVIWAQDIYLDAEGNEERMVLERVAVAKKDKSGDPNMYLTAAAALVDVQRESEETSLYITAKDVAQWSREDDGAGILRGARNSKLTHEIDLPSIAQQRPSSLTFFELLELHKQPRNYPPVESASIQLQSDLHAQTFFQSIEQEFMKNNSLILQSSVGNRQFHIRADELVNNVFKGTVKVTSMNISGERSVRELLPKKAKIIVEQSHLGMIEFVTLQMQDVIVGVGELGENQRGELVIPNLLVRGVATDKVESLQISQLLDEATHSNSKNIRKKAKILSLTLLEMKNQILGRINQRFAMSVIPFIIVVLGSFMAIRYSHQTPLNVYAKVFIPAIIALLLVFAGGQMVRDNRVISGFVTMWSGNILVMCLMGFHWYKLRRT